MYERHTLEDNIRAAEKEIIELKRENELLKRDVDSALAMLEAEKRFHAKKMYEIHKAYRKLDEAISLLS